MNTIKLRIVVALVCSAVLLVSACTGMKNNSKNGDSTKRISTLVVGGGESHDFDTWYKGLDMQTLAAANINARYTDDVSQILSILPNIDVLVLTNNQPIKDLATREAIFNFVESGKGLVLGHAALWYNWKDWPEYNKTLVGGGSKGHDKYGSFDVTVVDKDHPVTKGVPGTFELKDELYYFIEDPAGAGIEVLATANRAGSKDVFPSVFVVKNPHARILGIALGHDEESHGLDAYKKVLINAIQWVAPH